MKIKKVCEECGSDNVTINANAEWDVETQSWELLSTYEHSWCSDCYDDINIIDQEIKETTE